jgi:MFS family permease
MWAGSVPFVSADAHMSTADVGAAFTFFTAAYIGAMMIGGKLLAYINPRRILVICLPFNALALGGLLLSGSALQMTACLVSVGLIMGLIDLVMNTEGTLVEADLGRPILARLHCLASSGTAIGALAGSVFALTVGLAWAAAFAATALCLGLVAVIAGTPDRPIVRIARNGIWAAYSAPLVSLGIVFGIGVAGESAAMIWSGRLLAEQAPNLAVIAGIGVSFFAGCQAVMRFAGDRLRRAFGDLRLVALSLVVATLGFAVVGASSGFAMSVIGFALVGIGTAMQVPCLFALAARSHPTNGGAALAFVALVAGLPRLAAPWAMGEVAVRTSTGVAFGVIAVALLFAIGLALAARSGLDAEA